MGPTPQTTWTARALCPPATPQHSAAYYDYRPENNRVSLSADWTAALQSVAATRLTGVAITSEGGYQPGDDIEVTATFNDDVRVSGRPGLRLRVGEVTREAALHSHSYDTIVFRYRVQESDSDAVDGVSVPPSPIALSRVASIAGPGGGRVSLFFAGLPDDPAHKVYPGVDRAEGSSVLVWSPVEDLFTGVEGARYRLFERMRHYYIWNETTQRWEVEFRIADAGLDGPDQDLIQWLVLRADGYFLPDPGHPYGAAPVEDEPWLGGYTTSEQRRQQLCTGLKVGYSPGVTWEQRLEELGDVSIERIGSVGFGEFGVYGSTSLRNILNMARSMVSGETCPDPPAGAVTLSGQGQAATRGEPGSSDGTGPAAGAADGGRGGPDRGGGIAAGARGHGAGRQVPAAVRHVGDHQGGVFGRGRLQRLRAAGGGVQRAPEAVRGRVHGADFHGRREHQGQQRHHRGGGADILAWRREVGGRLRGPVRPALGLGERRDRDGRLLRRAGVDRGQRVRGYVAAEVRRGRRGAHGRPARRHPRSVVAHVQGGDRSLPHLRAVAGAQRGRQGVAGEETTQRSRTRRAGSSRRRRPSPGWSCTAGGPTAPGTPSPWAWSSAARSASRERRRSPSRWAASAAPRPTTRPRAAPSPCPSATRCGRATGTATG